MSPCFAVHNGSNSGRAQAELRRERFHGDVSDSVKASDLNHAGSVYKRVRMSFTPRGSAFSDHIAVVIGCCSEKEMFRITAGRVIAFVANKLGSRNRPTKQFPSNTMRRAEPGFAVTLSSQLPFPYPASGGLLNLGPKAFDRFISIAVVAIVRAVEIGISGPTKKLIAAGLAGSCYFGSNQGVNLRNRFANWVGSFGVQPSFEPFLF